MRIVLDLQSCQTAGSKNRGIGRYSIALAEAMIRQGPEHEFFVVLNGAFPEEALEVRKRLVGQIPADHIRTFDGVFLSKQMNNPGSWRHRMSKRLREELIASLEPDAVHVTSVFEGSGDLSMTDMFPPRPSVVQAATLYDMIPYIYPDLYLVAPEARDWYYRKLQSLKRADLLLAISSSSRDEATTYLHMPSENVVNISSAISPAFGPIKSMASVRERMKKKYGLNGRFVMYTGGIDYRKNIEGLIEAYGLLPADLRRDRQLAIVCSVNTEQREALLTLAKDIGLAKGDLVVTGYVPEKDLIALYNAAELFVFPSVHEGFGLPVLEAMTCGVPTIGSNTSSIPEVIGLEEALFDPRDLHAITAKMEEVLRDEKFAERLRKHGLEQSRKFSWDASAKRALEAIVAAKNDIKDVPAPAADKVLRLALVTPLPPLQSGIAGYANEMLPELCRYYDVEVVTDQDIVESDWAKSNCDIISADEFEKRDDVGYYDRIVYQMGNSEFHAHMPDLMLRHPGTVVLHDYFLSGLHNWRRAHMDEAAFVTALVESHGYPAIAYMVAEEFEAAMEKYPANGSTVESAAGLIVHSQSSMDRLIKDYGVPAGHGVRRVPLPRARPLTDRETARAALGLTADDILICSFGIVAPPKLNHMLMAAFVEAGLATEASVSMVFVGRAPAAYGESLLRQIRAAGKKAKVRVTGFVDDVSYHMYLAASDIAVQLRGSSRGETSAAALDVLNYGVPLVVNAHGTMAELDPSTVVMLDDKLTVKDLAIALRRLVNDKALREAVGRSGKEAIRQFHSPDLAGRLYRDAIEAFAARHPRARHRRLLRDAVDATRFLNVEAADLSAFATASIYNMGRSRPPRLFVDISATIAGEHGPERSQWAIDKLDALIAEQSDLLIEPVYMARGESLFRAARRFTMSHLGWRGGGIVDIPVEPALGDVFMGLDGNLHSCGSPAARELLRQWKSHGVNVTHILRADDVNAITDQMDQGGSPYNSTFIWLAALAVVAEEILVDSQDVAKDLIRVLGVIAPSRPQPITISFPAGMDVKEEVVGDEIVSPRRSLYWQPRPSYRFEGDSARINTIAGSRDGRTIVSTGREGVLAFGPYLALPGGSYEGRLWGTANVAGPGLLVDVAIKGGTNILAKATPVSGKSSDVALMALLPFKLEDGCTDLEVRVWVDEMTEFVFHGLDICEIAAV